MKIYYSGYYYNFGSLFIFIYEDKIYVTYFTDFFHLNKDIIYKLYKLLFYTLFYFIYLNSLMVF